MLSKGEPFPQEYEAEVVDAPTTGEADFTFTDGLGRARSTTVSVIPWEGRAWTGAFRAGDPVAARATSGLFTTPCPTVLCAVVRGTAFLVDVGSPDAYDVVATDGPVMSVERAVDARLLLLVTPWSVTAVGPTGVSWTSPRIAFESVRVDEADGGWLRGVADADDDEPRDFALDLSTGELVGGVDAG